MTSERVILTDPRVAGIGDALRRAIPLPEHDREERAERHILRRADIGEAVKR